MYQPSQRHVTNEHVDSRALPAGFAAPLHERDVRGYIASRRLWPRADRCAPVSINNPLRNAQNIRLTDSAKGP